MDGLLVVDKPAGPTSHDVVARMRRVLGERRIGHTGTLDPMASGVLPLVLGKATRLAQFLSASDKHYEAIITLGVETDTCDALGTPVGEAHTGPFPDRAAIERALDSFRGSFLQQPPAYSAKKIDGKRSYRLARTHRRDDAGGRAATPAPVAVTAHAIEITGLDHARLSLTVSCTAGFYVRALAHDLGRALGTGGCLSGLRRTQSGGFLLAQSISLDEAERNPSTAAGAVVPMKSLLLDLPGAMLTPEGRTHALHGRQLAGADFVETPRPGPRIRLVDEAGNLVGIAYPGAVSGFLHPAIVLM